MAPALALPPISFTRLARSISWTRGHRGAQNLHPLRQSHLESLLRRRPARASSRLVLRQTRSRLSPLLCRGNEQRKGYGTSLRKFSPELSIRPQGHVRPDLEVFHVLAASHAHTRRHLPLLHDRLDGRVLRPQLAVLDAGNDDARPSAQLHYVDETRREPRRHAHPH